MLLLKVWLYVAAFYVSIFAFNMITNKRAYDVVYGHKPLNWKRFKILFLHQLYAPTKWFFYEFVLGLWHFDIMVDSVVAAKRMNEQRRARV